MTTPTPENPHPSLQGMHTFMGFDLMHAMHRLEDQREAFYNQGESLYYQLLPQMAAQLQKIDPASILAPGATARTLLSDLVTHVGLLI